jgi:TonB-linked SusC/RagA family outer membrane protein
MRRLHVFGAVLGLLAVLVSPAAAQQEVAGTVVEARSGRPLERVQVTVEGGGGTTTDARGRFRLANLTGTQVILSVAIIGYRPMRVTARVGDQNIAVQLTEMAVNLGELVVTGTVAGAEKRTLGSSVATVRAAESQELAPAPDMSNLINGKAPGVIVIPGTGQVGSGPRIKIRGTSSISLTDQPLIYIDGVRVINDVSTGISVQAFGSGIASRLNDINPNEIENIEIIKGPSAATLYGTEAANGVVNIITKRGRAMDRPEIRFGVRMGTNWFSNPEGRIPKNVDMVDGVMVKSDLVAQEIARGTPIFNNGFTQGYNLSITGGNQLAKYYVGAGYDYDKGVEQTNQQKRLTTNMNLTLTPSSKYDVQASLGIVKNDTKQACEAGCGGIWWETLFSDPANVNSPSRGFNSAPPEFIWYSYRPSQTINRFTTAVTLNHRPTSWFSHRLVTGIDQTDEGSFEYAPYLPPEYVQFCPGTCALGSKYTQRRTIQYLTFDYSASARVDINKSWRSTSSLGGQIYRRRTDLVWASGSQFPAPDLETVAAAAVKSGYDDYLVNTTAGVYLQEQVGWKDKLYLTGAVRVDNNSAFGKDFKWVVYPKFSASYVLAEGQSGTINSLKLRTAYGQSGQQPAAFAALRTYAPVTGGDGGPAVIPQAVGNSNLKPERRSEIEAGFDAGMLNERLAVEFSGYYQKTQDAILSANIPPSTGFPGQQYINVGAIQNYGFEAALNGVAVATQTVNLALNFTVSTHTSKVLNLGEGVTDLGGSQQKVGYPIDGIFYRRVVSADYDPVTKKAINVKCDDGKGGSTATCSSAPFVYQGVWDPKWEGAFSANLTLWSRLRLYGLVDFKLGNNHRDNNMRINCQIFRRCDENFNPQNYDPIRIAEIQQNNIGQGWVINNAGFMKLRELSANYSVPRKYAGWLGGRDANIGVSARNLFMSTKWTGLDPESYFVSSQFTRLEQDNTPQLASFTFTLNLTW